MLKRLMNCIFRWFNGIFQQWEGPRSVLQAWRRLLSPPSDAYAFPLMAGA